MLPLAVDRLTKDALPEAWKDGRTNALALSAALSVQIGAPLPWSILRRAISDALAARWLVLAPDSGSWPCEASGAAAVTLKEPEDAKVLVDRKDDFLSPPKGAHTGSATLEPNELQDLIDALPDVITAAAGMPLRFHVHITLGDEGDVPPESVTAVNMLLEGVSPDLCLRE